MVNTNNPNLDLFIKMVRQINKDDLEKYLEKSWEFDKLRTIAIIFNSRDRINGKKEKMISNNSMSWLKNNHNQIYKKNILNYINNYGCWNDLNFIIKSNKKHSYEYKLFAEQLKKDIEVLNNNDENNNHHKNISLCSKWVISPNHSDVIKIARYLFNNDLKNYQQRYRKEIIKPLRTHLDLLETKLCNKDYENIDYKKLPAKALSMYVKSFKRNDTDKYQQYLEDVKNNKINMKITGLMQNEIIKNYMKTELNEIDETLELQWKTFVDNFKNEFYENYEDIIPIVDVSGSMFLGNNNMKPIFVSVALGLLLSELNRNELHNKVITFSEQPKFLEIRGETLRDRIKSILSAPFGLNTNFLKTADLIINYSINHKKIICFTDMQFDKSHNNENVSLEDIHNLFMSKFTDNNLNKPLLIYWNLNGSYDECPINNDMENTSIISGFSEQLLKIILRTDEITPIKLMEETIKPYYNNIILI